ncbi:MAG: ATP-dependent helicase, partial [Bdellovibrionota bacterium]
MSTEFWLKGLNPEQVQAVLHDHGPMLILAGAGSGKTTVLVSRTGRLIQQGIAQPNQILVMTFTNKAARELKHRVQVKIGSASQGLTAGTFHSFGLQLLKKYYRQAGLPKDFGIVDGTDCQAILKELLRDVKVIGKDRYDLERILGIINRRRTGETKKNQAFDEYDEMAEILTEKFVRRMDILGVVDFEALLIKPLELLQKNPDILERVQDQYQQIMVDEFQDTNLVQMRLIRQLAEKNLNLSVVGDDDQSIYGWRGAQVQNILSFPQEFKNCLVVKLERNYRSVSPILDLANQVISKNKHRHGKTL